MALHPRYLKATSIARQQKLMKRMKNGQKHSQGQPIYLQTTMWELLWAQCQPNHCNWFIIDLLSKIRKDTPGTAAQWCTSRGRVFSWTLDVDYRLCEISMHQIKHGQGNFLLITRNHRSTPDLVFSMWHLEMAETIDYNKGPRHHPGCVIADLCSRTSCSSRWVVPTLLQYWHLLTIGRVSR